jgi:hypothetical protein
MGMIFRGGAIRACGYTVVSNLSTATPAWDTASDRDWCSFEGKSEVRAFGTT